VLGDGRVFLRFGYLYLSGISAAFTVGLTPAMAADPYGCRGDQACVKIAQTTRYDRACQRACKEYRFDYVMCYSVWGPSSSFNVSSRNAASNEENVLGVASSRKGARRFCGDACVGSSLYAFVRSYDLVRKVCNFSKIML